MQGAHNQVLLSWEQREEGKWEEEGQGEGEGEEEREEEIGSGQREGKGEPGEKWRSRGCKIKK